jgi:hypothetical protein
LNGSVLKRFDVAEKSICNCAECFSALNRPALISEPGADQFGVWPGHQPMARSSHPEVGRLCFVRRRIFTGSGDAAALSEGMKKSLGSR